MPGFEITREAFRAYYTGQASPMDKAALQAAGVSAAVVANLDQASGYDGVVQAQDVDAVFNVLRGLSPASGDAIVLCGEAGAAVAVLSSGLPRAVRENIPVPREVAEAFLGVVNSRGFELAGKPFRMGTGYGQLAKAKDQFETQPEFGNERMVLIMTGAGGGNTNLACNSFFRALFTREKDSRPLYEVLGPAQKNEAGGGPGAVQSFANGQLEWHAGVDWPASITLDGNALAVLATPVDPRVAPPMPPPIEPPVTPPEPPVTPPVVPPEPPSTAPAAIADFLATHPTVVADGAASPITGGQVQWAKDNGAAIAIVAANDAAPGQAFQVVMGFFSNYKTDPEKFGLPTGPETYPQPGVSEQAFTNGVMRWMPDGFHWEPKPVGPVEPVDPPPTPTASASLRQIAAGQVLPDGSTIHSVDTLLAKIAATGSLKLGALTLTSGTKVISAAEFEVCPTGGPGAKVNSNGTPRIDGVGPHELRLPTITFTNADGTALTFVSDGQMGGRLLQARIKTVGPDGVAGFKDVLYDSGDHPKRTNWGPVFQGNQTQGWPSLGGVEFCFGPNEHGTYNATTWQTLVREYPDGSVAFVSRTETLPGDTFTEPMKVAYQTRLPATGQSFEVNAELENKGAQEIRPHVWINFMLPAGKRQALDNIGVDMPTNNGLVEVHSSGDENKQPYQLVPLDANFNNRKGWLGIFSKVLAQTYSVVNHTAGFGVRINNLQGPGVFPKVFALGRDLDPGLWDANPDEGSRRHYFEFWFSINGNANFDAQNGTPILPGADNARCVEFRADLSSAS